MFKGILSRGSEFSGPECRRDPNTGLKYRLITPARKIPVALVKLPAFLLVCGLFLAASVQGQSIDLDQKISLNIKDTTFLYLLETLGNKGSLNFSYIQDQIPTDQRLSFSATDKPIREILDKICLQLGLEYILVEKQIVLKPKKSNTTAETLLTDPSQKHTISGFVKDGGSGELLLFASVWVKELKTGTSTNAFGFYSLTLPEGHYSLEYSYVGFRNRLQTLQLDKSQKLDIDLAYAQEYLETVVIEEKDVANVLETNQMSEVQLKTGALRQMPGFMGEVELIKSLQSVPGIKNHSDGSVFFYARGGNKDQNLILIDDAPVYNPSHLLGFFSSFTPDAIKDVQIYTGDIPLSYGGSLSSLVDIRTKDGNFKQFNVSGSLGIVASKISLEGPIKRDRSSFLVSLRRSQLELLLPRTFKESLDLYFVDFNGKINYKFDEQNRFYFSLYSGKDFYGSIDTRIADFGISWGNTAATARWNHLFNDKLFSNLILNTSIYDYYLYVSVEDNIFWNESISNISLKNEFTYYMDPQNTFKFGFNINGHFFNPGNLNRGEEVIALGIPVIPEKKARQFVTYFSNDHKVSKILSFRYGIRMNIWQNTGPTEVYLFDDQFEVSDTLTPGQGEVYHSHANLEPRFSLKYGVDSTQSVKASYSRTTQFIQLLSNSISPFTTLDVWMPAGPNIRPQTADQIVFGFYRNFPTLEFSIEAYYKHMKQQVDYEDHANLLLNPLLEGELRFGDAESYGIEFLLKKKAGKFNGWISYTLSETIRQIAGVNDDRAFPANYDRPHDLAMFITLNAGERWLLSANWVLASGAPITTPTGFYQYQGVSVPVYAERNNDRLPAFHRLDCSASYRLHKDPDNRYKHHLTFSIYNLYARQNPIAINFNKKLNENNKPVVPLNTLASSGLTPSQIALLGIVPSINYKFRF